MKREKQEELFKAFPNLYSGHNKSIRHSLMGFGFECGDGWFDLIYKLSQKISMQFPDVKAVQVKEKYGGLRFYVSSAPDQIFDLIEEYEKTSLTVCEQCGSSTGKQQSNGSWVFTRCSKCWEERNTNK